MGPVDPALRGALSAALDGAPGVVRVAFQPIVDVVRGVVAGYEALARFCGSRDDPMAVLAAAHALGAGARLEAIVLRASLAARAALPPNTFLTVNVSPSALATDAVVEAFAMAGDLRGVIVEVTEHEPVDDEPALRARLAPLRAAGALSGRLDAWLLAEGVETAGELEALMALGAPLAQGCFLGRPSPAMENVAPEAAVICRGRRDRARDGVLAALAPIRTLSETATGGAIVRALLADPGLQWIVLVDEHGRPARLAPRDGGGVVVHQLPVLGVTARDALPDVVRRLLVGPARERFAPVVLCDRRGAARGLLTVERLLERLATIAELRATPPASGARPSA